MTDIFSLQVLSVPRACLGLGAGGGNGKGPEFAGEDEI